MRRETPKQALAAREAHQALVELKKLVDEAAKTTHAAELESFHVAIHRGHHGDVQRTLQDVVDLLESPTFDDVVSRAREKLEIAVSV
jgi:hypothetical protein